MYYFWILNNKLDLNQETRFIIIIIFLGILAVTTSVSRIWWKKFLDKKVYLFLRLSCQSSRRFTSIFGSTSLRFSSIVGQVLSCVAASIFSDAKKTNYTTANDWVACGLYCKHIFTIVSDDRKWCLYYKCFISLCLSLG